MRSWAPLVAVSRRISMNSDPSLEYKTRLQARRQTLERYRRLDRLVARARLLTGIVFFVCVWLFGWWAVLPVIVFIGLLAYHDKVLARARRTLRSIAFYERGVARIEDRWIGTGDSQSSFASESHPYATDLDIFGRASLFELLNTARTRSGEATLGRWLLEPANRKEILRRQGAVDELRNNVDLREDLAVLGEDVRAAVHPELMLDWAGKAPVFDSLRMQGVAPLLSAFTISTAINY